jgi:predicted transcriptional regulator
VAVLDAPVAVAEPPIAKPDSPTLEEVVYNYLHLANGARISEIETELGITRFQAVDALHALIQKGLIVKQDRTYLAKEEALL